METKEQEVLETQPIEETETKEVKKEKVSKKNSKKKKNPNSFWVKTKKFFSSLWITGFFVRVYQEMVRVRWADKKTVITTTCVVLSFIFLFGVYIILDDFIIAQIFKYIY